MYEKRKFDSTAFGQAVKKAREDRGMTREKLAEMLGLSTRHVQYIETRGQHPSLTRFYLLATILNISVDQFFFHEIENKTTQRRQIDAMLDRMDENDLSVIFATAKAMLELKEKM
jgi:transcriptional regulator with XRE-family HTH domain